MSKVIMLPTAAKPARILKRLRPNAPRAVVVAFPDRRNFTQRARMIDIPFSTAGAK